MRIADAAERQEGIAWWQALFSGVGIVVTALGTAYLVLTFRETRRTAQAGVDAAEASKRSAEAAEAALALSRATSRMQLRPNVAFAAGRLSGGRDPAHWTDVEVQVTNYGATMAKGVRMNLATAVMSWPPAKLPPLPPVQHWSVAADMPNGHPSRLTLGLGPIDEATRGDIYRGLAAFVATLRIMYTGEDGAPYDAVTTLVCIGELSLEGRLRTFDPAEV